MQRDQVFTCADSLMMRGEQPSVELVAQATGLSELSVEPLLLNWWRSLPERVSFHHQSVALPELPEALGSAFGRIWQQAVEEAQAGIKARSMSIDVGQEEERKISDDALRESQNRQIDLENRFREINNKLDESLGQSRSLEAELSVLKSAMAQETANLKKEEQQRSNLESDLAHLRKTHEDSKRTFDQRIKEEQRHSLDQLSKTEADVRYYRNALEKLRDDVGKKESSMTKDIHDLQAELAKRDVKIDTQKGQLRSHEEEIKAIKQESVVQARDFAKVNSALLAETNKCKRLEDKLKEHESQLKRVNQKQLNSATEWGRRENLLRTELRTREEEVMRLTAKIASLEKRVFTQDEELRRLSARI